MRIYHHKLIPVLPRQQLIHTHRIVCSLRGKNWGKKSTNTNYIFRYSWEYLYNYHILIMNEMKKRNYKPNPIWTDYYYRGKNCKAMNQDFITKLRNKKNYKEHNKKYLIYCCEILKIKIQDNKNYDENEKYKFYSWVDENISI